MGEGPSFSHSGIWGLHAREKGWFRRAEVGTVQPFPPPPLSGLTTPYASADAEMSRELEKLRTDQALLRANGKSLRHQAGMLLA